MNTDLSDCRTAVPTDPGNECWWHAWHRTGSTSVVHVDLTPCAVRERHAGSQLNPEEHMRRQQFRSVHRWREFSLCRAALRSLVCRRLGCSNRDLAFGLSHHGKPFALVNGIPAPVSFNVSHSGVHGLIAVAPAGRIGVDVEVRRSRPDLVGTVRSIMSPRETRALAGSANAETDYQLYRVWTLKEALAKASGLGFSLDLTGVSIPPAMLEGKRTGELRLPHDPVARWRIEDLGNPQFAAALVVERSPDDILASG